MNANIAPTFAGKPSCAMIFSTVPDAGAGISVSTLSVLTSSRGSNSFIESPSCLSHLITVTSSTPSPNKGTKTLVAIFVLSLMCFVPFVFKESLDTGPDQLHSASHILHRRLFPRLASTNNLHLNHMQDDDLYPIKYAAPSRENSIRPVSR